MIFWITSRLICFFFGFIASSLTATDETHFVAFTVDNQYWTSRCHEWRLGYYKCFIFDNLLINCMSVNNLSRIDAVFPPVLFRFGITKCRLCTGCYSDFLKSTIFVYIMSRYEVAREDTKLKTHVEILNSG